jgi:hypothetical protein
MNIHEKLLSVQVSLKAPKSQFNNFGNYFYRSCDDILSAVKPLLEDVKCTILLDDEIVLVGDRFYVKATAIFTDCESEGQIICKAFAQEAGSKKGMDVAQVTGSTSTYARKYALNGLLCIDDSKDADTGVSEEVEKTELVERFKSEIKRTGKSLNFFLKEAAAKDISELAPDFLQNALTMLSRVPDRAKK